MIKLLSTVAAVALITTAGWSQSADAPQGPGDEAALTQEQRKASIQEMMGNMSEETQAQVKAALAKAEEAKSQIKEQVQAMKKDGASEEEIAAAIEQKRTQAREKLQEAIQALADVPEGEKAKLQKVRERIQKRLQERKAEFEENQAKLQEKKGDGEKPDDAGTGK
ncbi:MAG: hypothetical protein HQK83_04735 [Fibrobacteria bacterium]|nr:hypothetical protein [Fibrobacteria bacterium]